jgi:hypothetical protein
MMRVGKVSSDFDDVHSIILKHNLDYLFIDYRKSVISISIYYNALTLPPPSVYTDACVQGRYMVPPFCWDVQDITWFDLAFYCCWSVDK